MNPTLITSRFVTNYILLSIFKRAVAVDGPVPGIDPQWFKNIAEAVILTAAQYATEPKVSRTSERTEERS